MTSVKCQRVGDYLVCHWPGQCAAITGVGANESKKSIGACTPSLARFDIALCGGNRRFFGKECLTDWFWCCGNLARIWFKSVAAEHHHSKKLRFANPPGLSWGLLGSPSNPKLLPHFQFSNPPGLSWGLLGPPSNPKLLPQFQFSNPPGLPWGLLGSPSRTLAPPPIFKSPRLALGIIRLAV